MTSIKPASRGKPQSFIPRIGQAENALCTALHHVRTCRTAADLQRATARATRAATLLKQLSESTNLTVEG